MQVVQQVALKMQQLCKSQIVKLQALKADTLKKPQCMKYHSKSLILQTLRAKQATFTSKVG